MDFPKSVPGVGLVDGVFVDENKVAGTPGSLIPAGWGNAVTKELLAVQAAAGLAPDENNLTQLLQAIRRVASTYLKKAVGGAANVVLSETESQNAVIEFTGALAANISVSVPARGRQWKIVNATTGPYTLTLKTPDGAGAVITQGSVVEAYCDGVSVYQVAAASNGVTGEIKPFATNVAPFGYLKANGAAVSRATYAALFAALVTAAGFTPQAFTIPIGSGVFTKAAHGMATGARVRLSSTGALPTGLSAGVDYFAEVIDANTFYLSTTYLGTRLAASGAQSGVHSYLQSWFGLGDGNTTFNLPDVRGEFLRGWDDGRGIDVGRVLGSNQAGELQSHTHSSPRASVNIAAQSGPNGYYAYPDGTTGATGGGETRPRNLAFLVCIKY